VLLEQQGETRVPELLRIRYGRMSLSPFPFFRGAAYLMASDLASTPRTGFDVQLCGDAHLSNFGGFAAPDRRMVFDCNDFDETLPGPWEWDVKRLAASVAVAGRELGFSRGERSTIVAGTVGRYRKAMRRFSEMRTLDVWYSRSDTQDLLDHTRRASAAARARVQRSVAKAQAKDNLRAFAKLTHDVDGEPRLVSDPPLIVPARELFSDVDTTEVIERMEGMLATYRATLPDEVRRLVERYRLVDVARKVVGVGSVGTRAYIALLLGRDQGDPLFLQVKEARSSVLERYCAVELRAGRRTRRGRPAAHAGGGRRHAGLVSGHRPGKGRSRLLRPPALGLEAVP
jgi:uncharacterized protein (DUF2252 family)